MPLNKTYADRMHLAEGVAAGDWMSLAPFFEDQIAYVSPDVSVEEFSIPGDFNIPARLYRPAGNASKALPALVWFHGGAFIGGDLDMGEADQLSREISHRGQMIVLSVDYRLCNNGVTFPTPQNDATAAVLWVQQNRTTLGVGSNIFIGGASAGGCLAGSTVQILRDRGLEQVKAALLIYPVCHAELPEYSPWLTERIASVPPAFIFGRDWMKGLNEGVMGKPIAEATGHDFPGNADDLSGLPNHLIIHSEYDNLLASSEIFARDLVRSGVEVTSYVELGAMHGHLNKVPAELSCCDNSINQMVKFIRKNS